MKIKYLKQHNSFKTGDTQEVDEALGNYLVNVGAAKELKKEKAEDANPVSKKEYEGKGKEKKEK